MVSLIPCLLRFHIFAIATTSCSTSRWRSVAVEQVCLPWSGLRAVLQPSSRAGVLTMARRVRSAKTKQSGGCAYHAWPAAPAVLEQSSRAGVLTVVKRARSVIIQSSRCAYPKPSNIEKNQACHEKPLKIERTMKYAKFQYSKIGFAENRYCSWKPKPREVFLNFQ